MESPVSVPKYLAFGYDGLFLGIYDANEMDAAWDTAREHDGWIGVIHNVFKPMELHEVVPADKLEEVYDALTNPEHPYVTRERPVRREIDGRPSTS